MWRGNASTKVCYIIRHPLQRRLEVSIVKLAQIIGCRCKMDVDERCAANPRPPQLRRRSIVTGPEAPIAHRHLQAKYLMRDGRVVYWKSGALLDSNRPMMSPNKPSTELKISMTRIFTNLVNGQTSSAYYARLNQRTCSGLPRLRVPHCYR